MSVSMGVLPTSRTKKSCSMTCDETVRKEGSLRSSLPKRTGWLAYCVRQYSSRAHCDFSCRLSMCPTSDNPQASAKHYKNTKISLVIRSIIFISCLGRIQCCTILFLCHYITQKEAYRCFSSEPLANKVSFLFHHFPPSHIDYEPMPRICRACTFSFRALLLPLSSSSSSFEFFFTQGKKKKKSEMWWWWWWGTQKNNKQPNKREGEKRPAKSFVFSNSPSREYQTGARF